MLQYYTYMQYTVIQKIHTYTKRIYACKIEGNLLRTLEFNTASFKNRMPWRDRDRPTMHTMLALFSSASDPLRGGTRTQLEKSSLEVAPTIFNSFQFKSIFPFFHTAGPGFPSFALSLSAENEHLPPVTFNLDPWSWPTIIDDRSTNLI